MEQQFFPVQNTSPQPSKRTRREGCLRMRTKACEIGLLKRERSLARIKRSFTRISLRNEKQDTIAWEKEKLPTIYLPHTHASFVQACDVR